LVNEEMSVSLVLTPREVAGPTRWRWLLQDEHGVALHDHPVSMDPADTMYQAMLDVRGHLKSCHSTPERIRCQADRLAELGAWVGHRLFGNLEPYLKDTVVRVRVPPEAAFVLDLPLELAHLSGQPLIRRGVTLAYELTDGPAAGVRPAPAAKAPVGEQLRILALFAQPPLERPLALRGERHVLARTVRRLAARSRKAIELRVLQYGVTRETVRLAAQEYEGWDLVHIAGHAGPGVFGLELADGRPDPVPTADLVRLLAPAAPRLKIAVLNACYSGAAAVLDETLAALKLSAGDPAQPGAADVAEPGDRDGAAAMAGLARGLMGELGVAVVAMRYAVTDTFAAALSRELYERLLASGWPLAGAAGLAVPAAAGAAPSAARPPLSVVAPMVLGSTASTVRVVPPTGRAKLSWDGGGIEYFPDEPDVFVGRVGELIAATEALASSSGAGGMWFGGPPGIGKTWSVLELAYQHRHRFGALVWWQALTDDPALLFPSLVAALAEQFDEQADAVRGTDALRRYLPRLRSRLREDGALIVLDHLDAALTSDGSWRDPMLGELVGAMTGHGGESRVLLTGRQPPAGLGPRIRRARLGPLSTREATLLARQLPELARLLYHDRPPGAGERVAADRALARRLIVTAEGNPRVLMLADEVLREAQDATAPDGVADLAAARDRGDWAAVTTALRGIVAAPAPSSPDAP
jgi:hypothetical protein